MKKIMVVGESCLDVFVYCNASRLCPEAPVPVLNIVEEKKNPGMASNVCRNIQSLYMTPDILTNSNWYNITKTRYVHKETNHMFFRVDSMDMIERSGVKENNFSFSEYDAVVVSDYNKGFLLEEDIEYICNNHPSVFVDTKKILGPWVSKAKFIKINDYEFRNSKPYMSEDILSKTIHTMGELGCEYQGKRYATNRVEVKDLSGAGDTFMAAFVVSYIETNNIDISLMAANECASKVVAQKGVVSI